MTTPRFHGSLARCHLIVLILASGVVCRVSQAATVCDQESLNAAIAAASAGSTIALCDKTWNNVSIGINKNGTATAPIRLTAQTAGKVLLTGSSKVTMGGSYIVVDGLSFSGSYTGGDGGIVDFKHGGSYCQNCRLTNTTIMNYNPATSGVQTVWVRLYGQHNHVDHNYFVGKSNVGAIINVIRDATKPDYHRIEFNYFSRPPLTTNGGESVKIGQNDEANSAYSNSYTTVERNYFYRADGELEMISVKSSGNTIRRNTIVESKGSITLRQGNGNLVSENFIFGKGRTLTGGIRVLADDHVIVNNFISDINPDSAARAGILLGSGSDETSYSGHRHARDAIVAFNTIVNSERSLVFGNGQDEVPPENVTVANNIIVSDKGPLVVIATPTTTTTYADNIFYGTLGIAKPTGIELANPRLTVDDDGTHRLMPDSPAIGRARLGFDIKTDMDAQTRAFPLDVGADQYNGVGMRIRPLGACDVGPVSYDPSNACGEAMPAPEPPENLTAT
jgi:poly(beta-D-mannuronate) lyase